MKRKRICTDGSSQARCPPCGITRTHVINMVRQVHGKLVKFISSYMTEEEAVGRLAQDGVPPLFTQAVWKELEVQHPQFFVAYRNRLALIEHINLFNYLLQLQVKKMAAGAMLMQNTQAGSFQVVTRDGSDNNVGQLAVSQPNPLLESDDIKFFRAEELEDLLLDVYI